MTISQDLWVPQLDGRTGPKYRAIADALADDIVGGRIPVGQRLPTHRDLAWKLGVTVGTVSRAYAEAERRGFARGEVGRGTFVINPTAMVGGERSSRADMDIYLPDEPQESGPINMGFNFPPPGPEVQAARSAMRDLADDPILADCLGYQPHIGMDHHREAGARWLARGIYQPDAENVMITPGSHNAVLVALSAATNAGDLVLTERFTFPGIKAIARLLGLRLETVPMDADGLMPDAFEEACRAKAPKALYCVPTLQNPTCSVMPEARRREIAAIAERHNVSVVEDDIFALLMEDAPPPLVAFLPQLGYLATSISKTLSPGLRTGFVAGPPHMRSAVATAIRASTWMASPVSAELTCRWINDGTARHILNGHRHEAAARAALCREILAPWAPVLPDGALHAWLGMPDDWRVSDFVKAAADAGVTLSGPETFAIGIEDPPRAVRVCLGPPRQRARMQQGLEILADLLRQGPPLEAISVV